MALYQKITITDAGAALISGIILTGGEPLTFEAVAVGSGELEEGANPAALSGLIAEAKRLPVETVKSEGGRITVTARLATDTLTSDLYHREVGIYANGILLAYGNTGDKYDFIPASGNNAAVQKIIRVPLAIGTMQTAFAEMDTTDLVTHAALEARVKTVVEPALRSIFTEDMAEEAFEQAARIVAREVAEEVNADAYAAQVKAEGAAAEALVSEANINTAIDKALYDSGEYRTTSGTQDLSARCFEITKPVTGRVEQIEIPCRSTTDVYDRMYKGTPVYLSVFEKNEIGEWEHAGMSTNANTQTAGATAIWTFASLKLSGRPLRFIVVTSRENTAFDTSLYMGARVTASTAGAAYEESSLATPQNYLADVTFSGAYVKPKYITAEQAEQESTATGWAWIFAFPGAGGDYLMTIAGANIYTPDTSGTTTDAERLQIYVDRINAAQPHVTASAAEVPEELGSGGYFFILTATEPGTAGNVKLSGNAAAVRFSGDTLTGGKDGATKHLQNAGPHIFEHERKKWNTPVNAYRLLANRHDITEIPSDMDLSSVIFAFEMALNNKTLKSIQGLNMRSCLNAYGAFYNCPALETIDGAYFALCKDCYYMFAYDKALRIIGSAQFDYAENTQEMFRQCAIQSTGTSAFAYARNASFMFAECANLEDITSMGLKRIIEADGMFTGCILNKNSVLHIARNLGTVAAGRITIGINAELQGNSEIETALETIRGKGWTVTEEYNTATA